MPAFPKFTEANLEQLCRVIAEYMTGSRITDCFSAIGINESSNLTKWRRLFEELSTKQNMDNCSNNILAFLRIAFNPVHFLNEKDRYYCALKEINIVLSFEGFKLNEKGQIEKALKSATIPEAEARAKSLRHTLLQRQIHPDILKFCKPELLQENYFHAVLEASKSITSKIRDKTGLQDDGVTLIDMAFNIKHPVLAINTLRTSSELSEQKGFRSLIVGIIQMFRNPTAHEAKIYWPISEKDAIDLLTTISFIHRKLDTAAVIRI